MSSFAAGIRAFVSRWQEPLFWLPSIFAVVLVAFYLFPALDPRSGVDGLGTIFGQFVVAFGVMLAGFLTWALRTIYSLELTDSDERELIDHAAGIDRTVDGKRLGHGPQSWPAVIIITLDRAQWVAIFWLLLSRLLP